MKNRRCLFAGALFLTVGIGLQVISRMSDGFGQWYSVNIYTVLVNIIGRIAGTVPFSIAETGIYVLIVWLLVVLIKSVRKKCFNDFARKIFLLASVLFFIYCANCGVNYYRTSFAESAGYRAEKYTVEELKNTCIWLTDHVNKLAEQVERNEKGTMILSGDEQETAVSAMNTIGSKYSELQGFYPKPKGLMNHWILSVQSISGIYSPFTIEANYNTGMTDYNIPFTACHELSHLRGFMKEEEANFIAFLACTESENLDFQYSGYLLGWINTMNLLYKIDYESWEEIRPILSEAVEPDLKANSEFWDKYDGAVAEVADRINDTYLKANGQDEGVLSYGRMADLIVVYYHKNIT